MEVVDWDVSVAVEREFEGVERGGVWVQGQGQGFLVWDRDEHHGYGFEFDRRAEMDQEGEGDEELII